jgi:hydrogenase 3 maturation protease
MTNVIEASWVEFLTESLRGAARIVLLGIGNDLRGDDAAGLLCVRELEKRLGFMQNQRGNKKAVLLLDGGETPENQTGKIREFRPDLVVLLDAARGGRSTGEIFLVDREKIADEDVSTHRISLSMLVRYLEDSIGARVLFVGIEPGPTDMNIPVSAEVQRSIVVLVDDIFRALSLN